MGPADSPNCFRLQYKFLKTPFHKSPPFIQTSGQEAFLISQEAKSYCKKGPYIRPLLPETVFNSRLVVVFRNGGSLPPVIRSLNKFIVNEHFQMENLSCLKTLLIPEILYKHIQILKMLTFLCLLTSLAESSFASFGREHVTSSKLFHSAPRICTKVLKPVAAFLRRKTIRVLIYLDDFLLLAAAMEIAVKNTQLVVTLLQSLGFEINLKKSLLIPTQVITFPGFQIDSMCMMISLPAEKANKN